MVRGKLVMGMKAAPKQVYQLLFDIENWTKLLPHCEDVKIEKLTDTEQIATMKIRSGGRLEQIRTVRHFENDRWISFDEVPAPAPFQVHRGRWTVEKSERGVRVTVEHEIAARTPIIGWFIERIAWMVFVRKNSLVTMRRVKEELGG